MTKTIKRVIAGVSALAILGGVAVGGWAINEYVIKDNQFAINEQIDGETPVVPDNNPDRSVQKVSFAAMSVSREISEGVTKQVTASIEPADAENKAVDWSIDWIGDISEDISQYLTISPASDGSLTCNVTCIKSFRGKAAKLTATARDGGVSGSCLVSYEGEPSAFVINNTGASATVQSNFKSTITVPVSLTNVFGDVGESFFDDITVSSVSVTADVFTYDAEFDIYGYWEPTPVVKNKYILSQIKNLNDEGMTAEDTFTATYSDGNITVKSSHYLNSDNFAYDFHFTGAGGTYTGSLDHVENCVMTIKLECNGLTGTLVVNYRTGVNGINVPSVSF